MEAEKTEKSEKRESAEGPWAKAGVLTAAIVGFLTIVLAYLGLADSVHWPPFGQDKASASGAQSSSRAPTTSSTTPTASVAAKSSTPVKPSAPAAGFTSLRNGTTVNLCFTAKGTAARIPAHDVVWLVVLAPNADDSKPTAKNQNGGQPYIAEVLRVSPSGNWTSRKHQLGDPGPERPYWLDLYLADRAITVPAPGVGAQFSLLQQATLLNEIQVNRAVTGSGATDGGC